MATKAKRPRQEVSGAWTARLRLVHPFPSLVVAAVTVAIALFADASPSAATVVALGVGMVCFQFAIGVANDLVDASDDARTKPWKAIPRGLVSRRTATALTVGFAGAGLLITSGLPFGAWVLGMLGLACGLLYDVQLKRTAFSWLPFAIAFPLIPAWAFASFGRWEPMLWWVFPIGGLLGFALHLANQAPDIAKEPGVGGFAHSLGTERAANLALGLFGLAGIAAASVLLLDGRATQALLVAATVLLAGTMARRAVRFFGPDGLFGLLASSSAAMAIVFLSALREA